MPRRLPATPSAAPLEAYAARFDDLFAQRSQREGQKTGGLSHQRRLSQQLRKAQNDQNTGTRSTATAPKSTSSGRPSFQ